MFHCAWIRLFLGRVQILEMAELTFRFQSRVLESVLPVAMVPPSRLDLAGPSDGSDAARTDSEPEIDL
jgi:hypothetical protein